MTRVPYRFLLFFFLFVLPAGKSHAQQEVPLYTSYTTVAAREKLKERLIRNAITRGLSFPLSDSTEENWQDAFSATEVLAYHPPFVFDKIREGFDSAGGRSVLFQRSLVEVAYTGYPHRFTQQVKHLLNQASDPKVFAMCAEYLMRDNPDKELRTYISGRLLHQFADSLLQQPVLFTLQRRLHATDGHTDVARSILGAMTDKNFLPGQVVMYSFQRKNRDYPGLVLVRRTDGSFVKDSSGRFFAVPQLARSITNLPGYLSNGNTPQGLFKMYGFGVSMSPFIGPTPNIQMAMPGEVSPGFFMGDSTITDSVWTLDWYKRLLPPALQQYAPLYESYYAGLAGRSEIIAHGSTTDPGYYKGAVYYPLTPTQGCLCTRELWDGNRIESDQQKLVNALLSAGGATGYCVVVEIDDEPRPVAIHDILPYLKGK